MREGHKCDGEIEEYGCCYRRRRTNVRDGRRTDVVTTEWHTIREWMNRADGRPVESPRRGCRWVITLFTESTSFSRVLIGAWRPPTVSAHSGRRIVRRRRRRNRYPPRRYTRYYIAVFDAAKRGIYVCCVWPTVTGCWVFCSFAGGVFFFITLP